MTIARQYQVCLEQTPFYHCYSRCVRGAFLCGDDSRSGNNYDHRKQWIVSRLKFLSYVYAIDICAYAIMDNHYHVVLHVDKARAESWTHEEVAERWMQLYKGHILVDRWLANPAAIAEAEWNVIEELLETWRTRLYEIQWFMRGINETIARMANEEDSCKGRFWEGRYKSQALLDETALLSCMAYVDLNPVRSCKADDLVESDFTSIQSRLYHHAKYKSVKTSAEKKLKSRVAYQQDLEKELALNDLPKAPLMPFSGSSKTDIHKALPFTKVDYFELVDTTGRYIREDKRGFIAQDIPPILTRFNINPEKWINHVKNFERRYGRAIGIRDKLLSYAKQFKFDSYKGAWCKGVGKQCSSIYCI